MPAINILYFITALFFGFSASITVASEAPRATVELRGSIAPRCEVRNLAGSTSTLTRKTGELELPFTIECNHGFDYRIESVNGGLLSPYGGEGADLVPYDLDLTIPGMENRRYRSDRLIVRDIENFGPTSITVAYPVFGEDGAIRISVDPRSRRGVPIDELLAGNYSDVLRITLEPLD